MGSHTFWSLLPIAIIFIVFVPLIMRSLRRDQEQEQNQDHLDTAVIDHVQAPNITSHPSPNFGERAGGSEINTIVLHYTSMDTWQAALERLSDPNSGVSSHYLVIEDGSIYGLVAEDKRAWHAGAGSWRNQRDMNSTSIGIEIANQGDRPFTEPQMAAVTTLCQWIGSRHDISQQNVIGHSDLAPGRKPDPGWFFNWKGLAANGVGIVSSPEAQDYQRSAKWGDSDIRRALIQYGWTMNVDLKILLETFQRHHQQEVAQSPDKIGVADQETAARLAWLVRHK